jgi:hypothetical protein
MSLCSLSVRGGKPALDCFRAGCLLSDSGYERLSEQRCQGGADIRMRELEAVLFERLRDHSR